MEQKVAPDQMMISRSLCPPATGNTQPPNSVFLTPDFFCLFVLLVIVISYYLLLLNDLDDANRNDENDDDGLFMF